MSVATYTKTIIAGDDFYFPFIFTEQGGITPVDLTGATAVMEIRESATSPTVAVTMTGGITDAVNGVVLFSLTDVETNALLPRAEAGKIYSSSVKLTYSDLTEETILIVSFPVQQVATA